MIIYHDFVIMFAEKIEKSIKLLALVLSVVAAFVGAGLCLLVMRLKSRGNKFACKLSAWTKNR